MWAFHEGTGFEMRRTYPQHLFVCVEYRSAQAPDGRPVSRHPCDRSQRIPDGFVWIPASRAICGLETDFEEGPQTDSVNPGILCDVVRGKGAVVGKSRGWIPDPSPRGLG